jgi:hypothetical protein
MCECVCTMLQNFELHKVETPPTKTAFVRNVNTTETQMSIVFLKIAFKLYETPEFQNLYHGT